MTSAATEPLELLRFATAGSVDDGKSTLIGRLLYDSKSLFDDQLAALEDNFDLAHLTDGLRAERAQGITIEVAYRYFATPKRRFIIADSPGHVQYTRNMVTAASSAELLVLLVDASQGSTEQTRRHAYLAGQLGIPRVVVAVNKMDQVGFCQDRFEEIEAELLEIQKGSNIAELTTIPTSALLGDNVVSGSANTPWYTGPALLEYLEGLPLVFGAAEAPGRLFVQHVLRVSDPSGRTRRRYLGQVSNGTLAIGDSVTVLPAGITTRISAIHTFDAELEEAPSPLSVAIELADDIDVGRGDLLAHSQNAPAVVQSFSVTAFWMAPQALRAGAQLTLQHGTKTIPCRVSVVENRVELSDLSQQTSEELQVNDVGQIRLVVAEALALDMFSAVPAGGRLILVDPHTRDTVAAAVVTSLA